MSSAAQKQRLAKDNRPRKHDRAGRIGFVDSSLCKARLALWGGDAPIDWLLPYLERMDAAGFDAIDILDPETTALAIRQGENPWRLLHLAMARLKSTPANVWINARCLLGMTPQTPDFIEGGITALAECGIRRVTCFDAANDVAAIEPAAQICRRNAIEPVAALIHVDLPRQDVSYYADRARSLAGIVQSIALVDIVGSIDPVTTRDIITAMCDAAPEALIGFQTHCRSSVAEQCAFEAIGAGSAFLYSCTEAMAGGRSLPATGYLIGHLARRHVPLLVDQGILAEMDEFFLALAQARALPLGHHELPDATAARFSIPVAVLQQLETASEVRSLPGEAVQQECLALQQALAVPTLAHPIGAMVLARASANIANGKRSAEITAETAAYLRSAIEVPPASASAELGTRAGDSAQQSPKRFDSTKALQDRERQLLASWFPNCNVSELAGPGDDPVHGSSPQQYLKEQIERCPAFQSVRVRKGAFFFELQRSAEQAQLIKSSREERT